MSHTRSRCIYIMLQQSPEVTLMILYDVNAKCSKSATTHQRRQQPTVHNVQHMQRSPLISCHTRQFLFVCEAVRGSQTPDRYLRRALPSLAVCSLRQRPVSDARTSPTGSKSDIYRQILTVLTQHIKETRYVTFQFWTFLRHSFGN